jgi:hypothetical protein
VRPMPGSRQTQNFPYNKLRLPLRIPTTSELFYLQVANSPTQIFKQNERPLIYILPRTLFPLLCFQQEKSSMSITKEVPEDQVPRSQHLRPAAPSEDELKKARNEAEARQRVPPTPPGFQKPVWDIQRKCFVSHGDGGACKAFEYETQSWLECDRYDERKSIRSTDVAAEEIADQKQCILRLGLHRRSFWLTGKPRKERSVQSKIS